MPPGGLYPHWTAARAIETFIDSGDVGLHPLYLIAMAVHPHRGGPGLIALLALHDGSLLAARGGRWQGAGDFTELFPYDPPLDHTEQTTADYWDRWSGMLGGFTTAFGGFHQTLPQTIAAMAEESFMAHALAERLLDPDSSLRSDGRGPWDAVESASRAHDAVAVGVIGLSLDFALLDSLQVPGELKRRMSTQPSPASDPLTSWRNEISTQLDPAINELCAQAWSVQFASPRASVVLLRTAAERALDCIDVDTQARTLDGRITKLHKAWGSPPVVSDQPDRTDHREAQRRNRILAALDDARQNGNLVHDAGDVTHDDAVDARLTLQALVKALLRKGHLDRPKSARKP